MRQAINYKITNKLQGTLARAGVISTPHGKINTPAFIVGGTKATVKALTPAQIKELGAQSVLANVYHLMLRPGAGVVEKAGGLSKFMNWDGPTFTDSGGFQVFSLGIAYKKGIDEVSHSIKGKPSSVKKSTIQLAKICDKGVKFRSHIDGQEIFMTPESSMELQHKIGADIHMAFDELPAPLGDKKYLERSLNRTHLWAKRCLDKHQQLNSEHLKSNQPMQALFAVVQGARHEDLRRHSAKVLGSQGFDGFGIGGVFEPEEISSTVRWINEELPEYKPRHLLGMGSQPVDLFLGIEFGIDSFDCVAPTRQARNGALYTKDGRVNILNQKFVNDFDQLETDCKCYTCQNFTKAYLSHLFRSNEILGAVLASIHNEYFVVNLVENIRNSIIDETFFEFKKEYLSRYYKKEAKRFL